MKITFLHHSSFLIEMEENILLFDYFHGKRIKEYHFSGILPKLSHKKNIYIFASHKHKDHFDMDNLMLAKTYPNIHFIFSKDCKMSPNFLKKHGYDETIMQRITYVAPDKDYKIETIQIHTLKSTDVGVAFCVKAEEKHIYHAGDLNWWHWEGSEYSENIRREKEFKQEMKKIEDEYFNLAFIPLDPRQGEHAFKGFGYFMENIKADLVFPMHMWQDYSLIQKYKKGSKNLNVTKRIVDTTKENQTFEW